MSWTKELPQPGRPAPDEMFRAALWKVRLEQHKKLTELAIAQTVVANTPGEAPVDDADFFVLSRFRADRLGADQFAQLDRYPRMADTYDLFLASMRTGQMHWLLRLRRGEPLPERFPGLPVD